LPIQSPSPSSGSSTNKTDEAPTSSIATPSSLPFQEQPEQSTSFTPRQQDQETPSNMSKESRPDPLGGSEHGEQLNVVDPEALPEKPRSEWGGKSNFDGAAPTEGSKDETGTSKEEEISDEEKQRLADEEERAKVMKRMAQIVDKGLDKVKPLLEMIDHTIDEAEKKKENHELDEDAFVSKMKPLIENAHAVMQSTLDQIKALDPDNKFERLAKRHVEDAQASADEKQIIDGCNELSTRVKATIDKGKKAIEGMPKAKKELGPLFSLLSEPLLQILGAVGLLVAGVLNLLANILNALGLGGALTQVLQGLRINNLLEAMGYTVGGKKK